MTHYLLQDKLLRSTFFSILVSTLSFALYGGEGEGKESERKMVHAHAVVAFVLDASGHETTALLHPKPTSSHTQPSIQTTPMFTATLLPSPLLSSSPDSTPEAPKSPEPIQPSPLPLSTAVASGAAEQEITTSASSSTSL